MNRWIVTSIIVLSIIFLATPHYFSRAQTVDELNQKIEDQRKQIEKIEREIAEQQKKVSAARGERQTVESVVAELTASRNKILSDIKETESQITKSNLTIQKLGLEISEKEQKIIDQKKVIAENIQLLNDLEQTSLVEVLLTYDTMTEFWNQISEREAFNASIHKSIRELEGFKVELQTKRSEEEEEKSGLENFQSELSGEREAVETTKKQQDDLLAIAKNKELTYQQILNQKLEQKRQFEAALNDFESQLQIILDPDTFAQAGAGVLSWPVARRPIVITQQFGGTQFAKTNPHVYGRPFHNGTDIDLETGDKVLAALSGTVRETGNTDAVPGCYSWGKWVLIDHPNGLSSLYAHLSAITVSRGQSVTTGQQIGLGGNTGYSTGSHLHFTLYATQGVEIRNFEEIKATTGCAGAKTPAAAHDAYLDPMEYLPKL